MARATIFEYNGIQLRDCQTLRHSEQPVYASDGFTLEGMQYNLRVLGYFSGTTANFYPVMGDDPNAEETSAADIAYSRPGAGQHYNYLHQFLQTPQKPLKYYVDCIPYKNPTGALPGTGSKHPFYLHNVEPAIELDPNAALDAGLMRPTFDISGGPRCVSLDITHTASNDVMRVEVEYTWTKPAVCIPLEQTGQSALNPDANVQGQIGEDGNADPVPAEFTGVQRQYGVRSHTWTCYEQVDTNWFTTRTYNGELKIISPHANIHDFRVLCVPPLTPGMKRESIDYRVSSDKMTLQYTIVDKEVMITPPADFKNININHSEAAGKFGHISTVRLEIKINGNRAASRKKMLTYALGIIDYKLHLSDLAAGKANKFAVLIQSMDVAVSEGTHQDNSLTVSVTAQKTYTEKQQVPGQVANGQWFGFVSERLMRRLNKAALTNVDDVQAASYNNQLMQGNNSALVNLGPHYDGGIESVSCFHAVMAESCATDLSFDGLADNETSDVTRRESIRDNLSADAPVTLPSAPVEILDELPSLASPSLLSTAHGTHQYNTYFITTEYSNNAMSMSLPSSETTSTSSLGLPSAVFVRIGPAQWQKKVMISAERYGTPPRLPDPEDLLTEPGTMLSPGGGTYATTANLKLIKFEPKPHAPQYAPDMSGLIYRTDATYVYAMDRPPANLRYGIPDSHAASLYGQSQTATASYSPTLDSVLIPTLGSTATTQNAWQVNV